MLTLAELPSAYAAARAAAVATARPVATGPGLCRYCGLRWRPLRNSRLEGHALCVVTAEFRSALDDLWRRSPQLSRQSLADVLGVSASTVKAWTKPRTVERGERWPARAAGDPTPEGLRALTPRPPMSKAEVAHLVSSVQSRMTPARLAAGRATTARWERYRLSKAADGGAS